MKRWQKILLIILVAVLLIVGFIAVKHRKHLKILVKGYTKSTESIEKEKNEIEEEAKQIAKENGVESIRTLTDEELEMLKNNEITEEEAIELILGYKTPEELNIPGAAAPQGQPDGNQAPSSAAPSETGSSPADDGTVTTDTPAAPNQNGNNAAPSSKPNAAKTPSSPSNGNNNGSASKASEKPVQPPQDPTTEKVALLLGKMYLLKSQFTSDLAGIETAAREEFKSLPKEERQQESTKWRIGAEALDKAASLEIECDAEVNAVLEELTAVLTEANQSTQLVDDVRNSYEAEKEVTKSYYVSKFQD